MTNASAAERARRYRKRKHVTDLALMNGWSETDVIAVFVNKRGEHIAIDSNGRRVDLVVRAEVPHVAEQVRNDHATPTKRLYPPKAMRREVYEKNVQSIQENNGTKEQVRNEIGKSIDATEDESGKKAGKQFLALVDALPDGPDWHQNFPTYE